MHRPILIAIVLLAACGGGNGDEWGGYTEAEAKDVMSDPVFQQQVKGNAPGEPGTSPYARLLPNKKQVEAADLRKVTVQGQEAWEYRDEDNNFCVDVWEDEETENFSTYVGPCSSD